MVITELRSPMRSQGGAVLIMALVFLVILTILGVTAMSGAALEEKMAANLKEQTVAFQAAETAVIAGETLVANLTDAHEIKPGDATNWAYDGAAGWYDVRGGTPVWKTLAWSSATGNTSYDGLETVNTQPKFIIEETARIRNTSLRLATDYAATSTAGKVYYRITGRGTGGTDAAQSMVQTVYAKQFN